MIKSPETILALQDASKNPEPRVRIAVASGISNLSEQDANTLVNRLIKDKDLGVRKITLKSISGFSPEFLENVQKIAEKDSEPIIRDFLSKFRKNQTKYWIHESKIFII